MDADDFFATPVVWYPEITDDEVVSLASQMLERSVATRSFLLDEMTPSDYEMALEANSIDIDMARLYWDIASSKL